jgi:hypothetical protein
MSLVSMTEVALQRREDIGTAGYVPKTLGEVAGATAGKEKPDTAFNTALKTVVTYVPTEIITLYLAFVAAFVPQASATGAKTAGAAEAAVAATTANARTPESLFWAFLAFTPLATWLVYAAKVITAEKPLPLPPRTWPVWEMVAATLAFAAWAVALPDQPFTWIRSSVAGVFVLATSTILGMLAPLFLRRITP